MEIETKKQKQFETAESDTTEDHVNLIDHCTDADSIDADSINVADIAALYDDIEEHSMIELFKKNNQILERTNELQKQQLAIMEKSNILLEKILEQMISK